MKKILFINHGISHRCGVHAQGRRHFQRLAESKKYLFAYSEIDSYEKFRQICNVEPPDVIIYNYMPVVLPWVDQRIRQVDAKHVCVVHNITPQNLSDGTYRSSTLFDNYITLDFSLDVDEKIIFKTHRPLCKHDTETPGSVGGLKEPIKIGTFGFPFVHKGFHKVAQRVNSEFDKAIINLHMSDSYFCNNQTSHILSLCNDAITKEGIRINYTNNYLDEIDMIKYLSRNDINVLFYDNVDNVGVSAAIDYLISAQKPVLISSSQQFRNFWNKVGVYPHKTMRNIVDDYDQEIKNIRNLYVENGDILKQTEEIIEKVIYVE
jgi:hypothetical protein